MTEEDMSVLGSCSPPLLQALDLLVSVSRVLQQPRLVKDSQILGSCLVYHPARFLP